MFPRTWATIDLTALRHNVKRVKTLAPQANMLAMVKSNGYGHGLLTVAQALPTVEGFGVACLQEALVLRAAGIQQLILVMAGVLSAPDLQLAAEQQIALVVHQAEQLTLLEQTPLVHPVTVWLKLDTGMHRLGFSVPQAATAYQRLMACANVCKPITLLTHLADADELEKATTSRQIALFQQITAALPGARSIANSAGILAWPATHTDWVRPGIMLYGVSPFAQRSAQALELQPVMTLQSHLIAIHEFQAGDAVGYGGTWVCPEAMKVGVIAAGYGDGYPRHAKNGTPVLIRGKYCPLVGRVSMDMITIDLRACPDAQVGDTVTLWGQDLPLETVAQYADTIAYELLCRLTARVHFVVKGSEQN